MTPSAFIKRWKSNAVTERAGAQAHFIDLCALLDVDPPNANPYEVDHYTFERGAKRTGAGRGWADVWKRGHFAWEYKKPHGNLDAALKQLMTYALALENPPLLVVSDRLQIQIHTHFTGTPSETHTIALEDVSVPQSQQKLRWLFTAPDKFRPQRTTAALTLEAANLFGDLALTLQERGHDPRQVAHFLNKVLFCLFAEDAAAPGQDPLLPDNVFSSILANGLKDNGRFERQLRNLFCAMRSKNGEFGVLLIDWFNGGLFDDDVIIPLQNDDILKLVNVSNLNWSQIEPSIFGTLFERGLNPQKRSQLGAHYTDSQSIRRIINPVISEPLIAQWNIEKARVATLMESVHTLESSRKAADKTKATKALKEATAVYVAFIEKLKAFRVLDPACGSGNFLYMALQSLKDVELRVMLEAEDLGLHKSFPSVGPEAVLGIELDPYAAELARVTVWIGEIQWMLKHGFAPSRHPILKSLDQIACRDALMTACDDGVFVETQWPKVDVIVGNPPFLGGSKKRREMGDATFEWLAKLYDGRVAPGADLVCYWFEKSRSAIEEGNAKRAGLVSTNSIRGGSNRSVLDRIVEQQEIFNAWTDEPWVNEGAAVRVSIVCFHDKSDNERPVLLDGEMVAAVHSDLTASRKDLSGVDVTKARTQQENLQICFMGSSKKGSFDVTGETARGWLAMPNPSGATNTAVLRPIANAMELTRRPSDTWVIDFGTTMSEADAELYLEPFNYVVAHVRPERAKNNREAYRKFWWRHAEPRPGMRAKLALLQRYIATPAVAKHRIFVWLDKAVLPDQAILAFAIDDDTAFGILHSRFHEVWSLRLCSSLEDRPRYTPTTCFETFPFPEVLTLDRSSKYKSNPRARRIAMAAEKLHRVRENWLNPPEWTDRIPEIVAGYPERILPKFGHGDDLKTRTLTNLYNARQAGQARWLDTLHVELDAAVADAYGWGDYTPEMSDEEILQRLLALNLERTGGQILKLGKNRSDAQADLKNAMLVS